MIYKWIATLAFVLIVAAWTQRRTRARHVPLALAGIGLDLALVLILEFSRDVIGLTAEKSYDWMQWTHIGSSVLAVLLYVPVVVLGIRMLRGSVGARGRRAHLRLATAALAFRTVGFLFMWSI